MSNSGVIAFGTVNQRVGTSPSVLPLLGGSNLTNISISGNTFSYSVSEVAILNVGVFLQTIDDDKSYSIEIFDVTAGTSAQSYNAVADGQSASNYQSFVFNFGVISGHQYSVRMRGLGGGDPNNQLVVSQGTIWSTTLAGGGSGAVAFSAITSGTNTTATMTVGSGAILNVAPNGEIGASSIDTTTTVLGHQAGKSLTANGKTSVYVGNLSGTLITGTNPANNTFIGYNSGGSDTGLNSGSNTYIGSFAGANANGANDTQNTFVGRGSGVSANGSASGGNTALGNGSLSALTTGVFNVGVGYNAGGSTQKTGSSNILIGVADTNANASSNAIVIGAVPGTGSAVKGSSSSIIISVAVINSATTNDLYIGSGDTGFNRVAAGVMQPNQGNGTTTAGWIQTAGGVSLAGNYTNATAGLTNTNLSVTLIAGRTYSFFAALYVSNSTTTDGVQIDFGGGSATATNFIAQAIISDGTTVDSNTRLTTLTTTSSAATLTNSGVITVSGTITVNAAGTFIIRAAENSHTVGTLTMSQGSFLRMWDTITA